MKARCILFLLVSLPFLTFSQVKLSGTVFADINNNGLRDGSEPGIEGVPVSDQVQITRTDKGGGFQLTSENPQPIIMLTLPEGYKIRNMFWKKISAGHSGPVDFALQKADQKKDFSFIHASDTHISEKSVDRMEKMRKVINQTSPDFVLVTGDLVKDALRVPETEASGYYQLYTDQLNKITQPVWSVPGNHENFGIERHLSLVGKDHPLYGKKMYQHYLGPTYYSFNYGGVHFIGLDDVDFEDTWYYGHVDSTQLEWLRQDLALVSPATPVVTFAHIPFFSGGLSLTEFSSFGPARTLEIENGKQQFRHIVSNAHEILALFKDKNYPLNLTGHYHARQVYWYESIGQKTRFEQTGAVVGPSSERQIRFPSGVTLYTVKNGVISEGKFIELD
jgi:predicted MPP superfamily phosphohydrolase